MALTQTKQTPRSRSIGPKKNIPARAQDLDAVVDQVNINTTALAAGVGGGNTVVKVSLSTAQIENAQATPIELVAAPGAGKAIVLQRVAWNFTAGAANHDGTVIIYTNSAAPGGEQIAINGVIDIVSNALGQQIAAAGGRNSLADNAALFFTKDAPATGGDGSIDLYIEYSILDL